LGKVACINPKTNIPDNFKYVDLESVVGTSLIKAKLTTKQLAPSRAQRVAKKGDIFYQTVRPYQKNNFLFDINNYDFQYVFSTGYAQLRSEINNYFLFSYLQRQRFVNLILRRSTGTSYPAISSKDLSEIKIIFPRNSKEQENIGKIINLIDALITLQQRKLDQLKQLKTAMLQQLFVNKNYKQPILRFKNFNGNWEKRKFSELATIRRGLTYKPKDVRECGKNSKRVLRSSNINENSFVIYNDDVFVDKSSINIAYVHNNDILITAANGSSKLVGKHALIHDIPDNSAVHGGFMLLASSNNPEFINALMSSPWYSRFVNNYVIGGNGAIGNLKKDDLDSQIIYTPIKNEIKKIGHFFNRLDNLIALQQNKLTQLTTLKKYLLQKLFI